MWRVVLPVLVLAALVGLWAVLSGEGREAEVSPGGRASPAPSGPLLSTAPRADAPEAERPSATPTESKPPPGPAETGVLVEGALRLPERLALEDVEVYLQRKGIDASQRDAGTHRIDAPVSADGTFRLRVEDPGAYWLLARPRGEATFRFVGDHADGAKLGSGEPVTLGLRPGRTLRVAVADVHGAPIPHAFVNASPVQPAEGAVWPDPDGARFGSAGTSMGAEGDPVTITVPDDGPLHVRAQARGFARISVLAPPGEDDLRLTLPPASGVIRVRLRDAQAFPHAAALVKRVHATLGEVPAGRPMNFVEGVSTLQGLAGPATYVVEVWAADAERVRVTDIELTPERLEAEVTAHLAQKAGLGRVVFDGIPPSFARVFVRPHDEDVWRAAIRLYGMPHETASVPAGPADVLLLLPTEGQGALLERVQVAEGGTLRTRPVLRPLRAFRVPEIEIERDLAEAAWIADSEGRVLPALVPETPGPDGWRRGTRLAEPRLALRSKGWVGPLPIERGWIHWRLGDGTTGRAPLETDSAGADRDDG